MSALIPGKKSSKVKTKGGNGKTAFVDKAKLKAAAEKAKLKAKAAADKEKAKAAALKAKEKAKAAALAAKEKARLQKEKEKARAAAQADEDLGNEEVRDIEEFIRATKAERANLKNEINAKWVPDMRNIQEADIEIIEDVAEFPWTGQFDHRDIHKQIYNET